MPIKNRPDGNSSIRLAIRLLNDRLRPVAASCASEKRSFADVLGGTNLLFALSTRPADRLPSHRQADGANRARGDHAVMSVELEPIAILPENLSILRSAQSCGALDHGVEYPLQVARRSGDNLQKLADRGVLLQRFRQALLKQPCSAPDLTRLGDSWACFVVGLCRFASRYPSFRPARAGRNVIDVQQVMNPVPYGA